MEDKDFTDLMRQKALLEIAFDEAEEKSVSLMTKAGESRENYEQWRAWSLILKAVSGGIAVINDQIGLDFLNSGLYLSPVQHTDEQFLTGAFDTVSSFYMDCLRKQDILMASAFDLARQAVKNLIAEVLDATEVQA